MSLGKKAAAHLKELRVFNGLSPEGFGNILDQKRQAVSRWERGDTVLSLNSFDDICSRLGLDPTAFICADPKQRLSAEVLAKAVKPQ